MGQAGILGTRNKCWDHALASHAEHEELVMDMRSRDRAESHGIFQYIFCLVTSQSSINYPVTDAFQKRTFFLMCAFKDRKLSLLLLNHSHYLWLGEERILLYPSAWTRHLRFWQSQWLDGSTEMYMSRFSRWSVQRTWFERFQGKKVSQFFLVKHD